MALTSKPEKPTKPIPATGVITPTPADIPISTPPVLERPVPPVDEDVVAAVAKEPKEPKPPAEKPPADKPDKPPKDELTPTERSIRDGYERLNRALAEATEAQSDIDRAISNARPGTIIFGGARPDAPWTAERFTAAGLRAWRVRAKNMGLIERITD